MPISTKTHSISGDEMRIINDWLEDWVSERTNILADDVETLSGRLRQSALTEGYTLEKLEDASNGDVDRFVRQAVVSQLIAESNVAPLAPFGRHSGSL
jgi:hypothetical protein